MLEGRVGYVQRNFDVEWVSLWHRDERNLCPRGDVEWNHVCECATWYLSIRLHSDRDLVCRVFKCAMSHGSHLE